MKDIELLIIIHRELEKNGISPLNGLMHRLRHVIYNLPENQESPERVVMNSLNDLFDRLHERLDQKIGR